MIGKNIPPVAKLVGVLWAAPWTAFGLGAGLLGLATGGRAQRRGWVLEFYGGAISWVFQRIPNTPAAMTFGHTVLGRTAAALDVAREHELVHVRQYERWGPLFVPAYLLCSLILRIMGKDAYHDNPFEREAYNR